MKYLPQCSDRSVPRVSKKEKERKRKKNKRKGERKKLELKNEKNPLPIKYLPQCLN